MLLEFWLIEKKNCSPTSPEINKPTKFCLFQSDGLRGFILYKSRPKGLTILRKTIPPGLYVKELTSVAIAIFFLRSPFDGCVSSFIAVLQVCLNSHLSKDVNQGFLTRWRWSKWHTWRYNWRPCTKIDNYCLVLLDRIRASQICLFQHERTFSWSSQTYIYRRSPDPLVSGERDGPDTPLQGQTPPVLPNQPKDIVISISSLQTRGFIFSLQTTVIIGAN